ncbi:MAG TPA: entericidin A/B family lipoprotein [Acidobacteriaceae bacterium]|nr:entericidin A/B family lipoprotein [Acidobacteriaceae bacterium]
MNRTRKASVSFLLGLLLLACAVPVLSACNTTAGMGQDLSAAGRGVSHGAENVKQGM